MRFKARWHRDLGSRRHLLYEYLDDVTNLHYPVRWYRPGLRCVQEDIQSHIPAEDVIRGQKAEFQ